MCSYGPCKVRKNNFIGKFDGYWGPNWKVSFEYKLKSFSGPEIDKSGWGTIIQVSGTSLACNMMDPSACISDNRRCCSPGDRYPIVQTARFIHLATQSGDFGNAFWNSPEGVVEPNVWYRIELEQSLKENGKVSLNAKCKAFIFF